MHLEVRGHLVVIYAFEFEFEYELLRVLAGHASQHHGKIQPVTALPERYPHGAGVRGHRGAPEALERHADHAGAVPCLHHAAIGGGAAGAAPSIPITLCRLTPEHTTASRACSACGAHSH